MPNLARPIVRPGATRTKVLLVRQPVKSVRKRDEPDRTAGIFTQAYHFLDGIRALQGNLEKQDCFTIQGVKTA